MKNKAKNNLCRGVTLIELVVVLAVFMIIISVTVSIFISIIQHQKRILAQQEFLNQISYVAEYMSRSIRMAVKDTTGACLNGGPGLYSLKNYDASSGFYEGILFIANNGLCQDFTVDSIDGLLKESKNGVPAHGQHILSSKF